MEHQLGEDVVRRHRIDIATSGEDADDPADVKLRKRKSAIARRWQRWFHQTVLGLIGAVLVLFITQWLLTVGLCPAGIDAAEGVESYCACSYYELHCVVALITTKPEAILSLLPSLSVALLPVILQIQEYVTLVRPFLSESQGDTIFKKAQESEERPSMQQELGFMGEVKTELQHLYSLLQREFMDPQYGCTRKYRLAVLIDDLDRCPKDVVVKVLEAVILLLCDAPITSILLSTHGLSPLRLRRATVRCLRKQRYLEKSFWIRSYKFRSVYPTFTTVRSGPSYPRLLKEVNCIHKRFTNGSTHM